MDFTVHQWTMAEYLAAPARSASNLKRELDDVKGPGKGVGTFGSAVHFALEDPDAFERAVILLPDRFDPPSEDDRIDRWDERLAIRPTFRGEGAKARGKAWDRETEAAGKVVTTPSGYAAAKRKLVKAEKVPLAMSREDVRRCWRCVEAVRRRRLFGVSIGDYIDAGKIIREQSVTCTDQETGLRLKIRKDLTLVVTHDKTAVIDVKVHEEPAETAFERAAARHWYGLQAAFYADIEGDRVGSPEPAPFGWLVVGAHPDLRGEHPTGYYEAGPNWIDLGRIAYQSALELAKAGAGRERPLPRYWSADVRTLDTPPLWHVQEIEQMHLYARSVKRER